MKRIHSISQLFRVVLAGVAAAATASVLGAEPVTLHPSADLRIIDLDGDGIGDASHAEDAEHAVLNVGDNGANQTWRSVIKFDLSQVGQQVENAQSIDLKLNVRSRLLAVPRDWEVRLIAFPTSYPDAILIGSGGSSDNFSEEGTVIESMAAGRLKEGAYWTVGVTEPVKAAQKQGGIAFRVELSPDTNGDSAGDQVSFYAGSHEKNSPHLRPQLIIEP